MDIDRREFVTGVIAASAALAVPAAASPMDDNVCMYEAWDIAEDGSGRCVIFFSEDGISKVFDIRTYEKVPFVFLAEQPESFLQKYWLRQSELAEFMRQCGPVGILP